MTTTREAAPPAAAPPRTEVRERIVEIVSDSGEGAQKAGQTFGTVCAKLGNGVWTVEIIPAEIKPPARSRAGASGIRVRFGSHEITNCGESADLVVAFNEQVLYGRIANAAFRPGTVVLLESKWAEDSQEEIRKQYAQALTEFRAQGLEVIELPMESACLEVMPDARVGKNMFVVGMLTEIFGLGIEKALEEVEAVITQGGNRTDVGVGEGGVGIGDHRRQLSLGEGGGHVRRHHRGGHVLVRHQRRRGGFGLSGPLVGQVEPTIDGQTGQQDISELQRRRLTSGGHVLHLHLLGSSRR